MATPWDRISEEYRAYLEAAGHSADEFNDPSFKRTEAFNSFNAFKYQQTQQQLQQPTQDTTIAWTSSMSQAVTTYADYGGSNQRRLAEFLKSAPATRAPVSMLSFNSWKSVVPETELQKYFRPVSGGEASCQTLSNLITPLLLHPMSIIGESEDGYHGRIDQCVGNFLELFAPSFKLRRNSSQDSSSYPLKRPDFSATILNKGCFFRGEEKKLDSREDPRTELYSKLEDTWPFPGLPFVLGYFSIGATLTFCSVTKKDAMALHGLTLDLNNAEARLVCWNTIRNVSRIIKFMSDTATSISPNDMQDLEKIHSVGSDWTRTIKFSGGHVLKQINLRDDETEEKLNRVLAVLALLKHGVEGVQPIISFNLSSSVHDLSKRRKVPPRLYVLTAFGTPVSRVSSTAQLQGLVHFLLKTVERLNNNGITHRDLRLPNVVMNGDGSYGLLDWDDSILGLHNLSNAAVAHLATESHAPEMFTPNGTHDWSVDLWSIGHVIKTCKEFATERLVRLMNKLMMEPSSRPSVSEALEMLVGSV